MLRILNLILSNGDVAFSFERRDLHMSNFLGIKYPISYRQGEGTNCIIVFLFSFFKQL